MMVGKVRVVLLYFLYNFHISAIVPNFFFSRSIYDHSKLHPSIHLCSIWVMRVGEN